MWQNGTDQKDGDQPTREDQRRERPGITWALRSLFRPSRRAHLLTTRRRAVVLPSAAVRPPGRLRQGVSFPASIYQQTPTAAFALGGAASMRWGLGAFGHQQVASGIYRRIACKVGKDPTMGVECQSVLRYTLQ